MLLLLLSAAGTAVISILLLRVQVLLLLLLDLSQDASNLLLEQLVEALFSLFVKVVPLAKLTGKGLGGVTLKDHDALRLGCVVTSEVHVDKEQWNSVGLG